MAYGPSMLTGSAFFLALLTLRARPETRSMIFKLALSVVLLAFSSCSSHEVKPAGETLVEKFYSTPEQNSPALISRPTVVLVSIDGYRSDYNALFSPPNLRAIEHNGVGAKSLRPVYPSKTFPNHYSISTGLLPARHGIVSNEFYDVLLKKSFAVSDATAVSDGRWSQGDPIWVLAENAGLRTASYMWVGSEADIKGAHPNTYLRFSADAPNSDRVDHALAWLHQADQVRPHLVMLYFSAVDTAAHHFGTCSAQMREAIRQVDEQIGRLREGLKGIDNANLIIVSDHGMQDVDATKKLLIDESPEVAALLPKFKALGRGPQMQLYLNEGEDRALIGKLRASLEAFAKHEKKPIHVVTKPSEFKALKYGPTSRTGDLVIDPEIPWLVGVKASPPALTGANHGWNPKSLVMHGVFYAEGPAFRAHAILGTVDNINIAPLVLSILGVPIPKNLDGKLSAMDSALKR